MACGKSELCIFESVTPQVVVEASAFEELYPTNTITSQSDIIFKVSSSNIDYLDLNDSMLYVVLKFIDKDGKNLADEKVDVVPTSFLLSTLFKDCILTLNNERIEGGNAVWAHKCMIENLISFSDDTKQNRLDVIGYDHTSDIRKAWTSKSSSFSMCGPLMLDFFRQSKYLLPGVDVGIRLVRNGYGHSMKCASELKIKVFIEDCRLYVRRVKVNPSVLLGHTVGLNTRNAIYPIQKTQLVSFGMAAGMKSFYRDQLFNDSRLPKFVLVTFQETAAFEGGYDAKADQYTHLNCTSMTLSRNTDFRETYIQDFSTNTFANSYSASMVRNMCMLNKNMNIGISNTDWSTFYPFFTFVLCPDFDLNVAQLPQQGNLRLDIKFGKELPKTATVIVYGVFDSEIQINKNRTIIH